MIYNSLNKIQLNQKYTIYNSIKQKYIFILLNYKLNKLKLKLSLLFKRHKKLIEFLLYYARL